MSAAPEDETGTSTQDPAEQTERVDLTKPAGGSTALEEGAARRPPVRVGTVVWGLLLVAAAIGVLAVAAGYSLDVEFAVIVAVALAGVGLLVGTLLKGVRSRT